jgi:ketosteroid isomerase-like protein/mono/diheme cytochrome c family protein
MPFVSRRSLLSFVVLLAVAGALAAGFLWSGLYDVGADDPHLPPVHAALETLRERSIAVRTRNVVVPDLSDATLIRQGAGNYEAMCSGCHLAPGLAPTELSRGLYPAPPAFARGALAAPARQFWVIKHGIKASAMPAWGKSMDEKSIWGLVAFVQRLPSLTAAQYHELVESSGGHSHGPGMEEGHEHHHEHSNEGEAGDHTGASVDAPGNSAPAATVDRFSNALARGDLEVVKSLLDPEVLILESGGAEQDREEYLAHHAKADAAFLRDAQIHTGRRRVQVDGNLAWVATESELHLRKDGKAIAVQSTETMVLRRVAGAWRIVHIHWSSQRES